jgi:hypothetical protein
MKRTTVRPSREAVRIGACVRAHEKRAGGAGEAARVGRENSDAYGALWLAGLEVFAEYRVSLGRASGPRMLSTN